MRGRTDRVSSIDPLGRLRSAGLPRTVSVRDRDDLMAVQEELAAIPGAATSAPSPAPGSSNKPK